MKIFSSYKYLLLASAAVGILGIASIANAIPNVAGRPPVLSSVGTTDLFQDIQGGNVSVGNFYVTAAQIAGVPGYTKTVPLTGFSLTFANTQTDMILIPAGTLATGTITTAPSPSDGQRECVLSSQTQTALTFTANTGQTVTDGPTALVAMTPVCMTYSASNATWNRSP